MVSSVLIVLYHTVRYWNKKKFEGGKQARVMSDDGMMAELFFCSNHGIPCSNSNVGGLSHKDDTDKNDKEMLAPNRF